jgi:hypothetical protein
MENLTYLIYSILFCAGVFILWRFLNSFQSKEDKAYFKKQDERLADDRVYDPETGKFYTLEELENDQVFDHTKANELFTDEEIEKVFFDDDTFPLTHNYLLKQGHSVDLDSAHLDGFEKTAIANTFDQFATAHTYTVSGKSTLSIIQFEYKIKGNYFSDSYFVGVVPLKRHQPHFILEPASIKESLFRMIDQTNSTIIAGWNTACFTEVEPDEFFVNQIIDCLPEHKIIALDLVDDVDTVNVVVEVKGDKLYVKSVAQIDPDRVAGMISIIRNLEMI